MTRREFIDEIQLVGVGVVIGMCLMLILCTAAHASNIPVTGGIHSQAQQEQASEDMPHQLAGTDTGPGNAVAGPSLPASPIAKTEPVARERVADKKFLVAIAILGTTKAIDFEITAQWLNPKADHYEANPLYGKYPSNARLACENAGIFAGEVAMAYLLKKWGRDRWWSKAWIIEPTFQSSSHFYNTFHVKTSK
jgi:hypothetical protein